MKAIKHSHHEQYLRLSNDDAALLVSSGRWVFVSKFEARAATQRPRRHWPRVVTFVLSGLAIAALLMLATSAKATDLKVPYKVCLTQAQAAQVYPGKYLKYRMIGKERCYYAGKTLPKHAFIGSKPVERFVGVHGSSNRAVPSGLITGLGRTGTASSGADGSNPSRSTTDPRATGVAVIPARQSNTEQQRVQVAPADSISAAGTSFTDTLVEDAFLALTGKPESAWSFDAYWNLMTGWQR